MAARDPARSGVRSDYAASRAKALARASVPTLMLATAAALYLLFGATQATHSLFFLPVAFAGAGLGARAGLIAAAAAMAVVAVRSLVVETAYLTAELDLATVDLRPFVLWATVLALTGYVVGLISERGGSRGVGRDLGTEIMRALERQHVRMGYDLHDSLAQSAAASLMEAEILSSMLSETDPVVRGQTDRLRERLNSGIDEIRGVIARMRPAALSEAEFLDTLHELIDDFTDRTGAKVELSIDGQPETHSDSMRICIYRVIQEALSNVRLHARASRVLVSVRATKKAVYLLVADDGVGFDPETYKNNGSSGHFGLHGMRERVTLLGGELEIDAAPNQGTGIRARIPAL